MLFFCTVCIPHTVNTFSAVITLQEDFFANINYYQLMKYKHQIPLNKEIS